MVEISIIGEIQAELVDTQERLAQALWELAEARGEIASQ